MKSPRPHTLTRTTDWCTRGLQVARPCSPQCGGALQIPPLRFEALWLPSPVSRTKPDPPGSRHCGVPASSPCRAVVPGSEATARCSRINDARSTESRSCWTTDESNYVVRLDESTGLPITCTKRFFVQFDSRPRRCFCLELGRFEPVTTRQSHRPVERWYHYCIHGRQPLIPCSNATEQSFQLTNTRGKGRSAIPAWMQSLRGDPSGHDKGQ